MSALYVFSSWTLLVLAIVVCAALAIVGHVLVRRSFPKIDFASHNAVAGIALGVVGGLFTVTVSFIIAIVWQELNVTNNRVAAEVSAAQDLWHTSAGLPKPVERHVRLALIDYADTLVNDEWPAMRIGHESGRAEKVLTRMFEDVAQFRPQDSGSATAQGASLQHLAALHDARHQRLGDNVSGIAPFEWTVLFLGALAVIALSYLVGLPNFRAQLIMTGVVAAAIASMLVLIFELDEPFRGDVGSPPDVWRAFVATHHVRA